MNLGKFGPYLPKFGPKKFFFEIWASSLFFTYLRLVSCKKSKKSYERFPRKTPDRRTNERTSEGMETLDKRSVQLIPANGKQSDNKGQTSSATVMSRSGKLSEHLLASTKPREMDTKEQLANGQTWDRQTH